MLGGKNPPERGRERISGQAAGPGARFSAIASEDIDRRPAFGKVAKSVFPISLAQ
jgi:hypothetical protein